MRFTFTRGKKKILLLSCDSGISARVSSLTSGVYDVESSFFAHAIIEDEHYDKYRIVIADVDNDPDGTYNVVSKISDLNVAKNIYVILLTSEQDSYDVNSIVDVFSNVAILIKPIQITDIYNAIQKISKMQNSHAIKNIRTLKDSSEYRLLRDTDTNLFTKKSFYNKFNLFLKSNKRRNMHLMIFGIDNLDVYNALYDDDETQELMKYTSSKLSSSIIFFASRFSFDKIALVINGDEKTCQKVLTEIQINADKYNSPYPVIIHAGICEIMPQEGDAEVLCNKALTAYIYAKYTDSDFVVKYKNDLKNRIWNGIASVYNTKFIPLEKVEENEKENEEINDYYKESSSYVTNKPEKDVIQEKFVQQEVSETSSSYETPSHISSETSHEIDTSEKLVDEVVAKIEEKTSNIFSSSTVEAYPNEETEEDNPFAFNGQLDLANGEKIAEEEEEEKEDNPFAFNGQLDLANDEETIEVKEEDDDEDEEDNPFAFDGQLNLSNETPSSNKNTEPSNVSDNEYPFQTKEFTAITFDDIIEPQETENENSYIDENENSYDEATSNNDYINEVVDIDENEEKTNNSIEELKTFVNEDTPITDNAEDDEKPFSNTQTFDKKPRNIPLILEKEPVKEIQDNPNLSTNNQKAKVEEDIKTYVSLEEFKNECTKILSRTHNHNPLYLITTESDYEDDVSYPDLVKLIVYSVFNSKSHICNYEKNNFYIFIDDDYDDVRAKKLANDLITKLTQSKYGGIVCKIGIGISGPKSSSFQNCSLFTLLAYRDIEKRKESSFTCKKSTN